MAKATGKTAIKKKITKKTTSKKIGKSAAVAKVTFRPDARQTAALVKLGLAGAANAIRATKALGLPITYLQNGILYRENADGTKEIIIPQPVKRQAKKTAPLLKKGMVLHAKK